MWFPGLSGELSFPGALGEGGHCSEEPRVGGCLSRASRQEERTPPTQAEGSPGAKVQRSELVKTSRF